LPLHDSNLDHRIQSAGQGNGNNCRVRGAARGCEVCVRGNATRWRKLYPEGGT